MNLHIVCRRRVTAKHRKKYTRQRDNSGKHLQNAIYNEIWRDVCMRLCMVYGATDATARLMENEYRRIFTCTVSQLFFIQCTYWMDLQICWANGFKCCIRNIAWTPMCCVWLWNIFMNGWELKYTHWKYELILSFLLW